MRLSLTRVIRELAHSLVVSITGHDQALAAKTVPPSIAALETLEQRTLMSTYFVSASGSDNNSGLSASSAWKSISKVNSSSFHAGDVVKFQGGKTFYGSLNITSRQGGNASTPVTYESYNGQATINSGRSTGAYVDNAGGVWFENLKFVGTPSGAPQAGINFEGYNAGVYYSNNRVDRCEISGYWTGGILIEANHTNGGLSGLSITNCDLHDNIEAGIQSAAPGTTGLQNIYIGGNNVHDNTGYGNGSGLLSGSGIELGDVSNVTVEFNYAFHNGASGGDGGVGIWAYSSNNVTFQFNESYDNVTRGGNDGDGFDFDADVSNSLIQYNYAFDNDGTGAQLDQWHNNNTFTNDTVRYNVFQDNGRKNNYGNLEVWGKVLNANLYNNVIYTIPGENGTNASIRVHNSTIPGLYVSNVHFFNNVIDSANGANLINVTAGETAGAQNLTFTNNVYWSNGYSPVFIYGTRVARSLAQFQSFGQESINGLHSGVFANPRFSSAGNGGVIDVESLPWVPQYNLLPGSPALGSRQTVALAQIASPAAQIFSNTAIDADKFAKTQAGTAMSGVETEMSDAG